MKYLALLRGINVGGNNIIRKDELKACFEAAGCESVLTYIQSGNILFRSKLKSKTKLIAAIQAELEKILHKEIPVILFTEAEYRAALQSADHKWGEDPEKKHNALFVLGDQDEEELLKEMPEIKAELEQLSAGKGVLFWSASRKDYDKTGYAQHLVKSPAYKKVSIRNSNTSFKLLELFEKI